MSNVTPDKYRRRVAKDCGDELLTEQSHKAECDINTILNRYLKTGLIDHSKKASARYGDFTCIGDSFAQTMNLVAEAQELFESVPSHIRTKFSNNPAEYMEFMMNEENRDAIEALGLPTEHFPPRPATLPAGTPANGPTGAIPGQET